MKKFFTHHPFFKMVLKGSILSLTLITGVFITTYAQTLPGSYSTSWVGNTFAPATNEYNFVQGWANSMFVDSDGTIYTNCFWDEAAKEMGVYRNGQCVGAINGQHGYADGGAVTANSTYVWASVNESKVRRFLKSNYTASGTDLRVSTTSNIVRGLVASSTELFASDFSAGRIKVYNASTGKAARNWLVNNPGPLALDAAGNVWVLIYTANAWGPGNVIRCYSNTGTLLKTVNLAVGVQAKSIAIDKTRNELLVSDIGDNMQIHIYNNISTTPVLVQSFGTQGGILSGTKGLVAPLKFNVPSLVGVDASSNIIVWSNGNNSDAHKLDDNDGMGACVESYTRAGVRNWQMLGLEFVDMGTYDPATDGADLYTKHEHFTMDYSKPDGQQWTWKGWTVDRKKYPDDARCHNDGSHLSTTIMRRINGKLFMYMTAMAADGWWMYRFDNANEGEIAIPCGSISQYENLWIDTNGNGKIDAGEKSSLINIPLNEEFFARQVDVNGTIWFARLTGGIYNYPVQSINSFGVPVYSNTSAQVVAMPAPFTDIRRINYDVLTDVMYLSGYTAALPNSNGDWGVAGTVLARYNNWSTGNRVAAYTINLPWDPTPANLSAISFTVEKDYIFVVGVGSRAKTWVYKVLNGTLAGIMMPGANVGGIERTGWCDLRYSVGAFKKSTGEYLVTVEEDFFEKILVYRWTPGAPTARTNSSSIIETEETEDQSLSLYPNPATGYTTVDFKKNLDKELANVTVVDLLGRKIYNSGILSKVRSHQINTSAYPKGNYIIRIRVDNINTNRKLIIE